MKYLHALAALAAAVMLGTVASACGGAPTDVGFTATTYSNRESGFAIQYPSGFTEVEVPQDAKDPGAPELNVFFVDPEGVQIGGKSVDTLEAAVYQMSGSPDEADFTTHKKDFEAMLTDLVGDLPDLKIAKPLAWTTIDSRPAVTETYTYTIEGKDVAASAQLAFKDDLAYLVRAQASRATWATTGRELVSSMATFEFL